MAEARLSAVFKDREYKVLQKIKAKELEGSHYEPLFPYFKNWENCYRVVLADLQRWKTEPVLCILLPHSEKTIWLRYARKNHSYLPCKIGRNIYSEVTDFAGKFSKGQDVNIKDYLQNKANFFILKITATATALLEMRHSAFKLHDKSVVYTRYRYKR